MWRRGDRAIRRAGERLGVFGVRGSALRGALDRGGAGRERIDAPVAALGWSGAPFAGRPEVRARTGALLDGLHAAGGVRGPLDREAAI